MGGKLWCCLQVAVLWLVSFSRFLQESFIPDFSFPLRNPAGHAAYQRAASAYSALNAFAAFKGAEIATAFGLAMTSVNVRH